MSDNPLDLIPEFDRVSIRAVVVSGNEDPTTALIAAGIFDPVSIPVIIGQDAGAAGNILGDGITPNIQAVLERQPSPDFAARDQPPDPSPAQGAGTDPAGAGHTESYVTRLPAAFGQQPLAPVRRIRRQGFSGSSSQRD